jgi:hypothetical protein
MREGEDCYYRVGVERAVDVGVGLVLTGYGLVSDLRAYPLGVDDQQHEVGHAPVERVGHQGDLPGGRGVDVALLGQRQAAGRRGVLPVTLGLFPVGRGGDVVDKRHQTGV